VLDCLGFPWILSSESRLFNGLRGFKREEFFSLLVRRRGTPGTGACGLSLRKGRIVHGASLIYFLIFCKRLPPTPFPFGRLNPKASRSRPCITSGAAKRADASTAKVRGSNPLSSDSDAWIIPPLKTNEQVRIVPYDCAGDKELAHRAAAILVMRPAASCLSSNSGAASVRGRRRTALVGERAQRLGPLVGLDRRREFRSNRLDPAEARDGGGRRQRPKAGSCCFARRLRFCVRVPRGPNDLAAQTSLSLGTLSPSGIQPGAWVEMAIARHCGLFQTLWVVSAAPDALAVTPVSRPFVFSAVSLIYQIDIKVLRSSVLYA
jgi:hypothetical protein